jgi:two-component system, NarL family, response regulator NreC
MRTVLLVDDSPVVRKSLCELFTREADFQVCGEAENGNEAIEKALSLKPSLIVIDLSMPELDGLSTIRILKQMMPNVPFILYTAHDIAAVQTEAVEAGAAAVISKSEAAQVLIMQARAVTQGYAA